MIKEKINKLSKNRHLVFLIISIIATIPILFFTEIPISHDIMFHLSRIKGISYELMNNRLYSGIYSSFLNNLGYASPLFYPDIFLYPYSLIYHFTNLVFTYKILIFSLNLGTLYVIDFVIRKYFKDQKTIYLFDTLYLFSAYRMVNLYLRGAIGEVLAYLFLPLIVLGLKEIFYGNQKHYYYLVFGMTGLIYSHVISTLLGGIFILLYFLLHIKTIFREKRFLSLLKAVLLTTILSLSFLVPLVEQLLDRNFYIYNLGDIIYDNIAVPLYRLFLAFPLPSSVWYPLGIGLIFFIIIIWGFKYFKKLNYQARIYLFLGIFFLWLSSSLVPRIFYDKFFYLIQYNWRFYLLASISLFFLILEMYHYLNKKEVAFFKKYNLLFIIIILTSMLSNSLIYQHTKDPAGEYLGYYEYLPEGISYDNLDNIKASCNQDSAYEISFLGGQTTISYDNSYNDTLLTLPLLYYKGYQTTSDYEILNNNGLVALKLKEKKDKLVLYYDITDVTLYSRIISLTAFMIIIIYLVRKKNSMTN